jgi:ribonuclease HII
MQRVLDALTGKSYVEKVATRPPPLSPSLNTATDAYLVNKNLLLPDSLPTEKCVILSSPLDFSAEAYLVDGNALPSEIIPGQCLVKGDSKSYSIAAASILAKVSRDEIMTRLSAEFPEYAWAKNAGYGTKEHLLAIETFGVTKHHRLSFSPVKWRRAQQACLFSQADNKS